LRASKFCENLIGLSIEGPSPTLHLCTDALHLCIDAYPTIVNIEDQILMKKKHPTPEDPTFCEIVFGLSLCLGSENIVLCVYSEVGTAQRHSLCKYQSHAQIS